MPAPARSHRRMSSDRHRLPSGAAPVSAYISWMANRPCNPDADTRRLWQMLMPGTPMPSCGIAEGEAASNDNAAANTPESGKDGPPAGDKRP